jgi:hypothetical protein
MTPDGEQQKKGRRKLKKKDGLLGQNRQKVTPLLV